jgi:mannose-6-phosphate isomerase-like protein (cupin superfamily)
MSDYTVLERADVHDVFEGRWPGEMRFYTHGLKAEQVALTWRLMPPKSGGKGSYGHRHKTQEEIYYVASGQLQFKLDEDIVDAGAGTAIRVAPQVVRSVCNDAETDAELVIVSVKTDDPRADAEQVPDFWPSD